MAYKLLRTAEERWRRFNGHELVADVLDGAHFKNGVRPPSRVAIAPTGSQCSGPMGAHAAEPRQSSGRQSATPRA
jgi:hypothetical protein